MGHPRLLGLLHGPDTLTLVRHGESEGNLADARARDEGRDRLDLAARDADVALSDRGQEQARAVGRWLAEAEEGMRPTVVVASPYRRAHDTARHALEHLDGVDLVLDERLRERDLGAFDGLTGRGIRAEFPGEAERRGKVGKFYYQPPSGESWADVVLRVRSFLADLRVGFEGERVFVFTHQAVIMAFRYVVEGIDEARLLEIDRDEPLPNASMTRYVRADGGYDLERFAGTEAVDSSATEVTDEEPQHRPADDSRG